MEDSDGDGEPATFFGNSVGVSVSGLAAKCESDGESVKDSDDDSE